MVSERIEYSFFFLSVVFVQLKPKMGKVSSPWCCKPCLFFTDRKSRLDKHLQTFSHQSCAKTKTNEPKKIFFCTFCTYVSPKIKSVLKHQQKVHNKQSLIESFDMNEEKPEAAVEEKEGKGTLLEEKEAGEQNIEQKVAEEVFDEFQLNEAADSLLLLSHSAWFLAFVNQTEPKAN